jgi:hypothetical protein
MEFLNWFGGLLEKEVGQVLCGGVLDFDDELDQFMLDLVIGVGAEQLINLPKNILPYLLVHEVVRLDNILNILQGDINFSNQFFQQVHLALCRVISQKPPKVRVLLNQRPELLFWQQAFGQVLVAAFQQLLD